MFFVWHPYMWWPLIDPCYHFLWDGKKYKYLLHLRSHRGKCHSFLHRPARSDSYPVGGPLHKKVGSCHNLSGSGGQKRGWQQRPFIMWQGEGATKPKVYYGRRQIGFGQRGTQWESPWWVKVNWRNVEIGKKKFLLSKSVKLSTHDSKNKQTSCSNPTTIQVTRPRPNSGGGRQHRQIPVYTWLVVVDDDEFLRVVIRLKRYSAAEDIRAIILDQGLNLSCSSECFFQGLHLFVNGDVGQATDQGSNNQAGQRHFPQKKTFLREMSSRHSWQLYR